MARRRARGALLSSLLFLLQSLPVAAMPASARTSGETATSPVAAEPLTAADREPVEAPDNFNSVMDPAEIVPTSGPGPIQRRW